MKVYRKRSVKNLMSRYGLLILFSFFFSAALAQSEVACNDGIDNDGDGLVDCADGTCSFAATIERGCNCYDGIDNDGDGRIDQGDSNCASYFGLTFVGEGSDCSIVPPGASTPFDMVGPPVVSGQNTADTQSKVIVGDIDNDGVPDAVITSKWNSEVRVVATTDGQADGSDMGDIKADYNLSGKKNLFKDKGCGSVDRLLFEHETLTADIDGDGKSEIFTIVSNRAGNPSSPPTCFFLMGFEYDPGGLEPLYDPIYLGTNRPGTFGIADMDGDGLAEIYLRDRIFAAETGALLASEGGKDMTNTALWDVDVTAAPVAVDIKSAGADGGVMELIVGPRIYQIPTLTSRNPASPASLTLWRDMNTLTFDVNEDGASDQYYVKLMNDPVEYGLDTHSSTSVADIDKDGYMDVVLTGALNSSVGNTTVFYWNVQKGTVSGYMTDTSADLGYTVGDEPDYTNYLNGWIWGTGRVNIGDANGDGKLDLAFVAGNQLYTVTTDAPGTKIIDLWANPRTINDSRSGVLTVSIYDFDNDGNPEMVYRDSQEVVVIDGATGMNKYWSAICQSHTYTEGPVIADMNGDGATDIGVTCNRNNSFDINDPIQQQALGEIRMFYSSGNEWLPTRKIWNQPGYHVVNINDDMTLPFPQLDGALVFSPGACANGLPGPQTPFNVFLNQVPFLSADGCPVFPAPDLAFVGDDPENLPYPAGDPRNFPAVVVRPPICGNLDIQVSFNIINDGDLPISDLIPVSFFHGDPTDPSITADSLLYTTNVTVTNLQVGDTLITSPITFNGPGTVFRLYIVLNNNGSVLPIDPNGSVTNECRIDNNIYDVLVAPDPFTAVIEKVSDNDKCVAADPDAGELRARIYKGDPNIPANEVVDYSDYAFQWYFGVGTANPVSAAEGGNNSNLSDLAEGDYTLVVTNTAKGCSTLPVDTAVLLNIVLPEVTINVLSHQTVCSPPNGALEAVVAGGNTGYSFEWFRNATTTGKTTAAASGLVGDNYIVYVSRNGCTTTASKVVNDEAIEPTATATSTPVENCQNPNSGSVTAQAVVGGVVQDPAGFTFNWYFHDEDTGIRGSILPGLYGTGKTRTGLPVGFYEVEVINNATQCVSPPLVIEVEDNTVVPDVTITELAPQTSCDPDDPNGRLQALVSIGGVPQDASNFTFEWFVGQNTLPANLHTAVSGVNGSIAESVKGGGQSYTIKVTTALQCFAITDTVITETLAYPIVTLTPTPNTICDPALATATNFTGSVAATVTFGGNPVTDFTNYTFTWYNGSLASGVPRTETSDGLVSLDDGYYTVVVERTDLSCSSTPETEHVADATVLPVVTASGVPSTNCTPSLANGSALVSNVDGVGTGSPYTFQWHTGSDLSSPIAGATNPTLSNRQGGVGVFFTVLTTNTNTGCQQTSTVAVQDNRVLPTITLAPTPNSVCDPALTSPAVSFNGAVVSTITNQVGGIADYTFAWSNGATVKDLANVDDGSYSLTTTHTPTGCVSDPVSAQVIDQTVLPAITTSTTASTNCVAGLENGQALVTAVVPASPNIMLWHQGLDLSAPLAGETNALLDKRQGGVDAYYTVLVTNQNSGCQNTMTVLIPDDRDYPVITLATTDNTRCIAPYDGSASLTTLTYNGAAVSSPYTGYSFAWSNGATATSITQQQEATFTVEVTKDDVGCTSTPVIADIEDDLFIPPIDIVSINQTSCDANNPNGALTATIDETIIGGGAVVNSGYTFTWRNNGAGPGLTIPGTTVTTTTATNGQINTLPGNLYYTVSATRTVSGCVNTETIFLPEVIVYPVVVAASTNPVTRCDTPNGAVSANVSGTEMGYTFFWMNEVGAAQTTDANVVMSNADQALANDGDYIDLRPGNYTVVARDNFTSCVSQPVTQPVADNTLQSTVEILPALVTPAVCGLNTGVMQANITGGVGPGFDVYWYRGGPVNSVDFYNNPIGSFPNDSLFQTQLNNITGSTTASNLYSALYSVLVLDKGNGCGDYDTRFLPFADPHIINETITNSTLCLPSYNGGVSVDVQNPAGLPGSTAAFNSYEFYFYEGSNIDPAKLVSGPETFAGPPVSYGPLEPGSYTVQIFENYSGNHCPVAKVIEIEQEAFNPIVNLAGSLTANSACDLNSADGAAEISISQDPNDVTIGTTYELDVSPAPLSGSYPLAGLGTGNQPINGLQPGYAVSEYTITVTSSTNCVTERFVTIPNQPSIAELVDGNVLFANAEFCNPSLETSAQIEVTAVNIIDGPVDDLSDYQFDWYTDGSLTTNILSTMGDGSGVKGGEILSNVGAPLPSSPVTVGSYWVVATKVNPGTTGGVGCFSAPFKVDIGDNTVKPGVVMTPVANTACDANYEGSITVDVTTASGPGAVPAATYAYDWTIPAGATAPGDGTGFTGISNVFTDIRDGFFTLAATNELTGCATTETTNVVKLDIPVVITTVDHVDNEYCFPNGQMFVQEVIIDGTPEPDHNAFNFEWFVGTPTSAPSQSGVGLDAINNLDQGTYYVVAIVDASAPVGSGCKSPPARADIKNSPVNPTVSFATIANTSCDNNFVGQITVTAATASGPGAAANANYDFNWLAVPAGNVVSDATDVPSPYNVTDVGDGQFTVRVINRITQCPVEGTVTLLTTPPPVDILTVSKLDQMICNPDGSMEVTAVSPATVADYNFRWFANSPTSSPLEDGASTVITASQLNVTNYQTISAGTYYVVGIKNASNAPGSGCSTPPFRIDIDDMSVDPQLAFTFEPNSSCNLMNPNGVVVATASERDGTTDTYTFNWTLNSAALPAVTTQNDLSPTSQLDNSFEGYYVLMVANTVTGCTYNQGLDLKLDRSISLPNIVQVDAIDPLNCFPTGSATVVEVTIGGKTTITDPTQLDNDFDYEWYKNDYPGNLLGGEVMANLPSQQPDRYFVLVKDLLTDCKSTPVEVIIEDADIIYPDVRIRQTVPQISCDDLNGTAVLVSTADNEDDTNPNYTFTWYPSLDLSGTSFASTSTISNLFSGEYAVEVFDATTNCRASELYIVPDNAPQFMPQLALSTSPRTRCDVEDGVLFASGVPFPIDPNPLNNYPFPYNYTAELYNGNPPADINNPEFGFMSNDPAYPLLTSNFLQNALAEGTYTVRLTDLNTGCVAMGNVQLDDRRVYPEIVIVEENPLINCDPARPNGQLSATADNGKVGGYSFEWFAGNTPTGTTLSNNYKLIGQTTGPYTVQVRRNLTGCANELTGSITDGTILPPTPTALLIQGRSSCIEPNGWVASNVNGVTLNYIFDWYEGSTAQGSADFTGVNYINRDIGPYAVTATDVVTGCISLPATVEVPDERVIPEVRLLSTPSYCLRPSGGVNLELITPNVVLTDIIWYDHALNTQIGVGPASYELPAGFYRAEFISSEGCENQAVVEVGTEILSYNLVSANGDNNNDVWIIDCIQNFPSNNVKVFNRSGVKVYEANGYNNVDVIFRGIGERGLYALGNDLPDGTYFYIIDKRDGSKPINGFLELVR